VCAFLSFVERLRFYRYWRTVFLRVTCIYIVCLVNDAITRAVHLHTFIICSYDSTRFVFQNVNFYHHFNGIYRWLGFFSTAPWTWISMTNEVSMLTITLMVDIIWLGFLGVLCFSKPTKAPWTWISGTHEIDNECFVINGELPRKK